MEVDEFNFGIGLYSKVLSKKKSTLLGHRSISLTVIKYVAPSDKCCFVQELHSLVIALLQILDICC